ncbi:MAG TPA: hypothetical protein VLH94_03185 [Spirochaetia bacterium]|nr:hypothetical protein [Spirochaetia bacterium]
MNNKKKIFAIIAVALVVLLGGAAVYVSGQLSSRQAVAPNAPTSKPAACSEECPGSDGVLRNCTGTMAQSLCDSRFVARVEPCGGVSYCCNGSTWSTNMSACSTTPTPTATVIPTATATLTPTATTTPTVVPVPTPKAKVVITINGTTAKSLGGTVDATNKKLFTSDEYVVGVAGTYKFEGQVSTIP